MPFRIVLAADGSSIARNAARYTVDRFGLPDERFALDVINVHYAVPPRVASALGRDIVGSYYRDESAQALEGVRKLLDQRGVTYNVVAKVGMPAARIVDHSLKAEADLIVMGSHGKGAAKSLLLGSVAQGVLAGCSTPVLLVRETRMPAVDGPIMVAIDGSAYTKKAIAWLLRNRELFVGEREIVLIHVVPEETRFPIAVKKSVAREIQEAEFEQVMAPARRQFERLGVKWREMFARGLPGPCIAAEAKRMECGLIVMGSHGRGEMTSLLLGSVTQRTLSESTVPMLVIR
jgi:nucleotide-binding universal stress UspA family protein